MTTLARAWLGAAIAMLAAIAWHHMEILGDGYWCIAAGDWVLDHRALPDADPFSYVSQKRPWILHMPAFQIGAAWLARHAGIVSVMIACTIAIAAAAAIAWLPHARTPAARAATFPLAVFYLLLDADDLSARGQAFGDLAFAILLAVVHRAPPPDARGVARLRPYVVPFVLGAAWANLHPSFLLAIAVPIAFGVTSLLDSPEDRRPIAPYFGFALAALVGACVNPYSIVLVLDVAKLASDPTTAYVDLFQSPDFHRGAWLLAPASGLAVVALRTRFGEARGRRADVAVLLLFVGATCLARRYGTLLVAVELAIAGRAASAIDFARVARFAKPAAIAATIAQLAIVATYARERKDPLFHVPAKAAAVVEERALPDRVMNPYHWGGYLDWAWRGRRKAFVDGRNNLFANGSFEDALRLEALADGWHDVLDAYEVGTVLWESGAPLDRALARHRAWQEVHRDGRAVVYVRRRAERDVR